MATILVTGAAGFMGSHLAQALLQQGHQVVGVDDLSGGYVDNVPHSAIFIEGSITDPNFVKQVFSAYRFDYVYHLAAYAAEGLSHFIKRFNYQNNVIASVNLINAAVNRGVRCFVFTSSMAVYGANQVPMREDMLPMPEDSYGIAKHVVEQELRISSRLFGLDYIIFRPHNVYGERQNIGDPYRNVIAIFMSQILRGQPMTIFGDGTQTRAFTHVADIIPTMTELIHQPEAYNQVFNIGADTPCSILELATAVANSMDVPRNLTFLPPRDEVHLAYCDHSKLYKLTGYKARIDLEEGLARMSEWVRSVGLRKSKSYTHIEIKKNIPPIWLEEVGEG